MAVGIMRTMAEHYESFTPSFRKIADYLREHPAESQYLSITELADACEVGKATISRFCAALGFDGYSRLKIALARSAANVARAETLGHIASAGASGRSVPDQLSQPGCAQRAHELLAANVSAMTQTLQLIDYEALDRSARLLHEAREVWMLGHGGGGALAQDAWSHFITISPKFRTVADSHFQIMSASLMDEGSVVVFMSYLGVTRDAADVLVPARRRGAKVVLVTHYANSPTAELADETVVCGGFETPLEGGSIVAKVSMLFAVDLLAGEFCRLEGERARECRDAAAEALAVRQL